MPDQYPRPFACEEAAVTTAERLQLTFVPAPGVPAAGSFALWGPDDLPAAAAHLGLPLGTAGMLPTVLPADGGVVATDVPARLVPVLPVTRVLASMALGPHPAWDRPSDAVLAWSLAAKLALEHVAAGRLVPVLRAGTRAQTAIAYWRSAAVGDPRLTALAERLPPAAHAVRTADGEPTAVGPYDLLVAFADAVADVCGRGGHRPDTERGGRTPRRRFLESWTIALGGSDPVIGNLRGPVELAEDLATWAGPALGAERRSLARLALRLRTPESPDVEDPEWRLDLQLQSVDDPEQVLPAAEVWSSPSGAVELAGDGDGTRPVEDATEALLRGLGEGARLWPVLERALDEATPGAVPLSGDDVAELVGERGEALRAAGIGVLLPPELDASGRDRLRLRLRVGADEEPDDEPFRVGARTFTREALTSFRYELAIGDDTLTREEFEQIVALKQPLVRWRDRWVRVDHDAVESLRRAADRQGQLSFVDALAAALGGFWEHDDELGSVDVVESGRLAELVGTLREQGGPGEPEIVGIHADLRTYQRRGIAWLQALAELGLGGVLADDMGTGKTLQAIGLLTSRSSRRPHLVVCPTSVVGNWERELRRFAPAQPVVRHHGPDRAEDPDAFPPAVVVVTSYALMRRDIDLLAAVDWDVVVFDEAQQIKNTASKGARAARELPANVRFALTGTPVENRLGELWAILDVTNPGLLGTQRRFTRRFAVPIERWRDADAAERLRRMISPFVLRRLKSDPEVSLDLPSKTEVAVACSLTREQATLYQAAVDQAFAVGFGSDTIGRRGRILALLTALKQICNHPAHYLGERGPLPGRSGKLARTAELLSEVVASGDRALVFTQYTKMGDLLVEHLGRELDLPEVPFLHGGVPLAGRDAMVERFQEHDDAPPVMVVSLRAGGTGLNLTRATEVVHYDRWWNPAVEQQATDRVHRIGQTRPVTVHTLITAGTIEDRIAELLDQKRNLAERVIGTGESWITELGDEELRGLVELSTDDVEDEDDAA